MSNNAVAPRPEWMPIFEKQVEENPKFVSYAFSTLDPQGNPRVRYVIHRGVTPSGIFLTTTDTRMQKPVHLASHSEVEIAWWIDPTQVQFRFSGKAFALPTNGTDNYDEEMAKVIKGLGLTEEKNVEGKAQWWEGERKRIWEKGISGHLRGTFARPAPGMPLDQADRPKEEWPSRLDTHSDDKKEQEEIDKALGHFAVIAIKPEAFEHLDLAAIPNDRTQWVLKGEDKWEKTEVCP